jgi:chemotaxis response regulator CheB
MGGDGAKGLLNLKNKGWMTIAQNKESCVVFGMPAVAIDLGAAQHVCHLNDIAAKIHQLIPGRKTA